MACSPPGDPATPPPLLTEVVVRLLQPDERRQWEALMRQYHYLGFRAMVGESLRYVAEWRGQWVALLGWQAAALKCRPRDRWIGWPPVLQYPRLHLIANNARFLILPEARRPNLASRVLALTCRRLSADWEAVHGHPVWLAETFVDPARFAGTCYRAANWLLLGRTRGYAKHQRTYTAHQQPKWVFVYPLHPQARQWLADPHLTPHRRFRPMSSKTLTPKQLDSLHHCLGQVPDCRHPRGRRHRLHTVLTIAIAGVLCGARSFLALGEFAASLTQAQLRRVWARRDPRTGRWQPPEESTLRRVLQAVDADALDRRLGQWLFAQADSQDPVAVDGKTLRGARRPDGTRVHLLSAFLHQQGVTVAQIEVGAHTNEIPALQRLLEPVDLTGRVVTADALHTQQETARFLVEEKQADYVFTVKDNQPTLRQDIEDLGLEAFPPSAHHRREGARPIGDAGDLDQHRVEPVPRLSACASGVLRPAHDHGPERPPCHGPHGSHGDRLRPDQRDPSAG